MRRTLVLGMAVGIGAVSRVVSGQAPDGPSAAALASMQIEELSKK